ncbi:glucan biosynthesis protein G [Thermithiobacillus plumbiphilus]|uniref:Glucans biosynthesis protein G n=1 Tax=Thermithiobacillus plumbiphilus TaxID=1729899 RepID=A0ABU9D730_9PROT
MRAMPARRAKETARSGGSAGRQLSLILYLISGLLPLSAGAAASFDFQTLVARAEKLARQPYQAAPEVPTFLKLLTYDQYRDIRYRPSEALWRREGLPFQAQFFHPGAFFPRSVEIHVLENGREHLVPFSVKRFDYGKNHFTEPMPGSLGYAGFRLHYPLNRPDYLDEVAVFLGASYFRSLGRNEHYGLSARGLAIDTAQPRGEEFPVFRSFWLEKPKPGATAMRLYALLDGPSVTGAYRFDIKPGDNTAMTVHARLFFRRSPEVLGIAPLTSMFLHGENSLRPFNDFRPEVHDSDGLALQNGSGEHVWRPLSNPRELRVSAFQLQDPKGFGLLQRDRDIDHYQDFEAHYQSRPSAWITPLGNWGQGEVRLVEIPTPDETNDNVVAFWTPAQKPGKGEAMDLDYRIDWGYRPAEKPRGGYVLATRRGAGDLPGTRRYVIDFKGGKLDGLAAGSPVDADVWVGRTGRVIRQQIEKNPATGGWRLSFQVQPQGAGPLELRAFLRKGSETLTETWSYLES